MKDPNVIVTDDEVQRGATDAGATPRREPCTKHTWCTHELGHDGECKLENRPPIARPYVGPAGVDLAWRKPKP